MKISLRDVVILLIAYCLDKYILPNITVFGIELHWALIMLGIILLWAFLCWCWKTFRKFLKDLIKESIKEL